MKHLLRSSAPCPEAPKPPAPLQQSVVNLNRNGISSAMIYGSLIRIMTRRLAS